MSPSGPGRTVNDPPTRIDSISAVTLATHDMARAVQFYRSLGFVIRYGGESAEFTSFHVGAGHLNLIAQGAERFWSWWGRVIFYVSDVDAGCTGQRSPRGWSRVFPLATPVGASATFILRVRTDMS